MFPEKLLYTKGHEWALVEGDMATIGITDFAQGELGDIVFVELPEVGRSVSDGESFGVLESVKTVSDLYAPFSGEVVEINDALENAPELVNKSAYEDGWIVKIKISDMAQTEGLLNVKAYKSLIGK